MGEVTLYTLHPPSLPGGVPGLARLRSEEGRCKATWKREFKLLWREAGPPNHRDGKVDSDQ